MLGVALPTAFTLLSGYVVSVLPEAIEQGSDSPASQRMLYAMIGLGLTFLATQVIVFARSTAAGALGRRFMGDHTRRVMAATLAPAGVARLEDPAYLDQVARALATNRHDSPLAVVGLVGDTVMTLWGVVRLVIVAYFQWWLAISLLLALVHSRRTFGPVRRGLVSVRMGKAGMLRRAGYLVELTLRPEAAKEIRVFGLADWLVERYEGAWLGAMAELWLARSSLWRTAAWAGLPVVAFEVIGLILICWDALSGTVGLGALVVYARGLMLSQQLAAVTDVDAWIEEGAAALPPTIRLERIAASEESLTQQPAGSADRLPRHEIRFERVRFQYPGERASIFSDLDLTIAAGRTLAIVGDNGAGKTTLVKLLARLYEPTDGRIVADNVDLGSITVEA